MIDETVAEIEQLQTHSSSTVAVKAARALKELLDREYAAVDEFVRDLERNSSVLRRANPSHASLFNAQREIVRAVADADPEDVGAGKAVLEEAIDDVVEHIETGKRQAAERAAEHIDDGATILTHDYSTTVLAAIEHAVADGADVSVYVTEARPRFAGRKTARALASMEGVETTLIIDSAAGHYLPECDGVLVGMDCIVGDTLYNRIGTYPIAVTAADRGVPVRATGSSTKVIGGEFVFENVFRTANEVMLEPAEGFAIENPTYDATPTRLLDDVITDSD